MFSHDQMPSLHKLQNYNMKVVHMERKHLDSRKWKQKYLKDYNVKVVKSNHIFNSPTHGYKICILHKGTIFEYFYEESITLTFSRVHLLYPCVRNNKGTTRVE